MNFNWRIRQLEFLPRLQLVYQSPGEDRLFPTRTHGHHFLIAPEFSRQSEVLLESECNTDAAVQTRDRSRSKSPKTLERAKTSTLFGTELGLALSRLGNSRTSSTSILMAKIESAWAFLLFNKKAKDVIKTASSDHVDLSSHVVRFPKELRRAIKRYLLGRRPKCL